MLSLAVVHRSTEAGSKQGGKPFSSLDTQALSAHNEHFSFLPTVLLLFVGGALARESTKENGSQPRQPEKVKSGKQGKRCTNSLVGIREQTVGVSLVGSGIFSGSSWVSNDSIRAHLSNISVRSVAGAS